MDISKDNFFQRSYLKPLFLDLQCPECKKIYRLDTKDLISQQPEFSCPACQADFIAEIDREAPQVVITRSLRRQVKRLIKDREVDPELVRACPKCQTLNFKADKECRKCGLIFENWELSQKEGGILPSLVKGWQELLQDYTNMTKHLEFIARCEELQALPYALKKYEELKEIQPQDELAQKLHAHVLIRSVRRKVDSAPPKLKSVIRFLQSLPWATYMNYASWGIPVALIGWGLYQPILRNLIGLGLSWLFVRSFLAWKNFSKQ